MLMSEKEWPCTIERKTLLSLAWQIAVHENFMFFTGLVPFGISNLMHLYPIMFILQWFLSIWGD